MLTCALGICRTCLGFPRPAVPKGIPQDCQLKTFRPLLTCGLGYSNGAKGGRPPFDPVAMFKVLVVQAQHNLSDARMEFMIRDRLSWMRFFSFDLGGAMSDENRIRHYHNRFDRERDA